MKWFSLLVFFLTATFARAQHFDAGIMAGASNYLGDLSENSSGLFFKETHFSGGAFLRYNFSDFVAARISGQYAEISGTDENAADALIRQRNLRFSSQIIEISLIGEINLLGYQPYNLSRTFSPYLFGGIAYFHFNPKTEYLEETVALQPLGTEGQGMEGRPEPYQLWDLAIPFGLGVKYAINDKWNIGLEVGARVALTDYLDDVSTTYVAYEELLAANGPLAAALGNRQGELTGADPVLVPTGTLRGDTKNKDWYFITGISISYNFLDNGLVGSRGRSKRGNKGCKTGF